MAMKGQMACTSCHLQANFHGEGGFRTTYSLHVPYKTAKQTTIITAGNKT